MQLKATLKIVNLFLALAAFLTVGFMSLFGGEDLIWVVGKAVGCFVACWIVLGFLAAFLSLAVEGPQSLELATGSEAQSTKGKKGKKEG